MNSIEFGTSGSLQTITLDGPITRATADAIAGFYAEPHPTGTIVLLVARNVTGGDWDAAHDAAMDIECSWLVARSSACESGAITVGAVVSSATGAGLLPLMGCFDRLAIRDARFGDLSGVSDDHADFVRQRSRGLMIPAAIESMRRGRVFASEPAECFGLVQQVFGSWTSLREFVRESAAMGME